jgi:hypothetical protein
MAPPGRLGPCEQYWRVNLPLGPQELSVFWGQRAATSMSVGRAGIRRRQAC